MPLHHPDARRYSARRLHYNARGSKKQAVINTLVYLLLAMLPGLVLAALEWADWKRRPSALGAPPPGHHRGTLFWFVLFSLTYIALSLQFNGAITLLFACFILLLFMDAMTFHLLGHLNFFRSKGITWSRKQQIRDGFVMASFLVMPAVLFMEAGHWYAPVATTIGDHMAELAELVAFVILGGIAIFMLARHSRSRHIAHYGPPPAGHHLRTCQYFVLWSVIYVLLGWQFLDLLTNLLFILLLVYFLAYLLDMVTLGFVNLFGILGFKNMGWSRTQQVRDSFILATLFVCPAVLLAFH